MSPVVLTGYLPVASYPVSSPGMCKYSPKSFNYTLKSKHSENSFFSLFGFSEFSANSLVGKNLT
jgi:hypothetical protein